MGLVEIKRVRVGDYVLGSSGIPRKVTRVWSRGWRGMMAEISYVGFSEPLVCTYDHKVLIKRECELIWAKACEILPTDSLAFPRNTESSDIGVLKIKEKWRIYKNIEKRTECAIDGCHKEIEGRGLCRVHYRKLLSQPERPRRPEQINPRYVRLPNEIPLTGEWLYMLGFYLAEGFASLRPRKSKFISFSAHEKERPILKKISDLLGGIGIKSTIYLTRGSKGIEMRSYSGEIALWFRDWFGHGAKNKRIPDEIMKLPSDRVRDFIRGYVDGDGYRRKNQVEWVSASRKLCYQMCILAAKCGYCPTMRRGSVQSGHHWIGGYTVSGSSSNQRLNDVDNRFVFRPVRSVKTYNDKCRVYDITVEKDHAFVSGLATVHNCHRIGQRDSVLVQHLVLEGSLDAHMAQTIIEKQKNADLALDKDLPEPVTPSTHVKVSRTKIMKEAIENPLKPDQVQAVHSALQALAAVCDGARREDFAGFNKIDSAIGKSLAGSPELTMKQAILGRKIVQKYHRQLPEGLMEIIMSTSGEL